MCVLKIFMTKTHIDEKILNLEKKLDESDSFHYKSLPKELKDLRERILALHIRCETDLYNLILFKISKAIKKKSIPSIIGEIIEKFSYREKLEIVKSFNDGVPEDKFKKVNTYRNEFVHPKGRILRDKYNRKTVKGKEFVKNLLEFLVDAEEEIYNYYIKRQ